ncbi:MAG: calcium/sodium antiporter [candidate division KSB1 bacterium]|nr:calcium/sodium antiporter [candidate division KSB1 bacterium]
MIHDLLWISGGFVLLYFGAEGLVRGSSSLAMRLKISPLVIGLTVVAYGTSMPEMVVSLKAALSGQGGLSIGNVVGSNIFNIAVILGFSALISPLRVKLQVIRIDAPIALFVALLFWVFFHDGVLDRWEGGFFLLTTVMYTVGNLYFSRRAGKRAEAEFADTFGVAPCKSVWVEAALILLGLGALVLGGNGLVNGSVGLARRMGVSEAVIGLTIVAAGTSLPELATSLVAAFKKEADIAVGNVIGSNIFNIVAILGTASLVSPIVGTDIRTLDIGMMIGLSLLIVPMMRTRFRISRAEGVVLIAAYVGYLFLRIISKGAIF